MTRAIGQGNDMTLDLDALKEIAKAATPGPWSCDKPPFDEDGFRNGVAVAATYGRQMIYANPPGGSFPSADQRHIAAFDPPTALALIAELAIARAQLAQAREALERARPWVETGPQSPWRDGVLANIDAALTPRSCRHGEGEVRRQTEVEIESAIGILSSMGFAIEQLERFWPPSKRGSNAQKNLDDIKAKRATALLCLNDAIAALGDSP